MLEITDHSAFPVINNQNRPVGLIERDAIVAMIENKCWYYRDQKDSPKFREGRVSVNNEKRSEDMTAGIIEQTVDFGEPKPVKVVSANIGKIDKELELSGRNLKHTGSINDDDFQPNHQSYNPKRGESLDFENNPEVVQQRLLDSVLKENNGGAANRGYE